MNSCFNAQYAENFKASCLAVRFSGVNEHYGMNAPIFRVVDLTQYQG